MLPDMGQTEKERGESHEWALMFMLLGKFLAELYAMASILIQINIFFLLIAICIPAVWIMKINNVFQKHYVFTSFFIQLGNSALL